MKSEIIDRILSENRESLQKIIETARNNDVFQDIMSNIKEEFFINDSIHGISHNERVALLSCYIGIQEGLDTEELKLVLEAAKYHDIGRGYEGNHGKYSTIIIDRNKEYIFPDLNDNEINIIKALCHGHSVDDSRYEEIAKMYNIINIDQFKKLLNIVKDADALDRVRLPRFGKLDEKYLRTETAHKMIELAENLYREYRNIQQEIPSEDKITESKYTFNAELREQLLFDGENYYLLRSLNSTDIDSLNNGNGIIPKIDSVGEHTVQDVMAQIRMQHRKTNLISMSEDPNIVLTYDKSNLHRFVLIKLSKEEIENSKKVFSAGEYLLGVIDSEIERIAKNAPEKVREILENVDRATSIDEIVRIINGADRQVPTSLVETEQQYLSKLEQLNQSKKIAKCKVLNYYGLMRGIAHDERGKLLDISEFTRIMRNGYSSSEWLYSGEISRDKIINIPQILIDGLALLKQAEFQGKDKEILRQIEQEVLDLAISEEEINQDNYRLEYSAHNDLKNDLTIDRAYEITNGQISYRDTNMQQIAIRSLAEMTLNKRKIIELLKEKLPNIDIEELLSGTYCINQEMITKQNNRGSQIGRNINFLISEYGYDFDEKTSMQILESVEDLTDEQLKSIISQGVNAQEISRLLIKTRENDKRIETTKAKKRSAKYIAEAIVEGYNWKKDKNSLTKKEKELLSKALLRGEKIDDGLYELYEAINKIQIGKNKFTQNDVFAIMINLAIDGKIGEISYSELLRKDMREIQHILLDNREELQTSVLPISMDLLAGQGKEIDRLKRDLINLGIDKRFIESKDIKNVYIAKKIVEEYIFERDISTKEKASLIKGVLNSSSLNKERPTYLKSLVQNMEQTGLKTQEIYGMIINLGVNRNSINEVGYNYSVLLNNVNDSRESIKDYIKSIQTTVTDGTINKGVSENLNKDEQEQIKAELIQLGIDAKFLNSKDIRNVYVAKQIVEGYDFNRNISKEEKTVLIKAILNNSLLGKKNTITLISLIQDMEQRGLNTQQIYGMIINLGINGKIIEENGYDYTSLLMNKNNCRESIKKYLKSIQTKLTEGTISKVISENLNKNEEEILISELVQLGIDDEFIASKHIRNLYVAKQIIEGYHFDRDLGKEEKKALIESILNNSKLNIESQYSLATLIQNLEQIGLSTQEIYGMIINLGVSGRATEETGYSYNELLSNKNNTCKTIKNYKDRVVTKVTEGTINRAISDNINEEEQEKLKLELMNLGIDTEFLESRDIRNLYTAKEIVDNYEFEREFTKQEKASLIKSILIESLNIERTYLLSIFIQNMEEEGLKTQEIYGIIINLGVNGNLVNETGYGYGNLIHSRDRISQMVRDYKDDITTKVTEGTISKAVSENLNQNEQEKIKSELIQLGIEAELFDTKDIRNVYVAKQIVEGYDFDRTLGKEEKAALIKSILNSSKLNKGDGYYLTKLIQNLEQIGLSTQEVFGIIINAGIYGTISNETGYNYTYLIVNSNDIFENIRQNKNKIKVMVTEGAIDIATSKDLTEKSIHKIKLDLEKYGIDREFIELKDIKNVFEAKRVVENFNFNRELSGKEKGALIKAILCNSDLNKKRPKYLTQLIQNLEQIGLNIQDIYAIIINLAVNGKVITETGYSYVNLLRNQNNSCNTIAQYKDQIQTEVTEETIQKAVEKANKPKKVKGKDIAKATMELTAKGSGGSQICDDVQADYMRLLEERTNNNQKEGSEQGGEN